jgi:hypothetical protein
VQIGEPRGFAGEHGADCQFQISGCGGGHMRMRMLRLRLLHVSKTGTTFYSSIFSLIVVAQNKTKQNKTMKMKMKIQFRRKYQYKTTFKCLNTYHNKNI